MITKIYNHVATDSLYKNSTYLMASNSIVAVLGFLFWAINARLFPTEEIGLATTLISAATLVTTFSLLGLNVSLIRYLPTSERKSDKINSVFGITAAASILISAIFLTGLKYFSPELIFVRENILFAFLFVLFTIFSSLSESVKNIFRAYRSSEYVLVKNTIFNILKLLLIFFLVNLGVFGIFFSWVVSLAIAFLISLIILIKKFDYKFKLTIKKDVIKKMTFFSFANYINEFFEGAPRLILPIMITNLIGAEKAAYFYIDLTLAGFLFMFPEAISNSFFAEGSANEKGVENNIKKVVKAVSLILIPSTLVVVFFGNYILLFFGKDYSLEGFKLLQLLAFSGIFVAINSVFGNIFRIKYRMRRLVSINCLGAVITVGLSYLFLPKSILGIGWAWLIGQGIMNLAYFFTTFLYKS